MKDICSQVESLQVSLQSEKCILREREEPVLRQTELGDAGPVEGVGVELRDVVPLQVQRLEVGDLVDAPGHVGQLAVLEAESEEGVLDTNKEVLVHVLDVAPGHGQVGEGDVVEEPGGEVGEAGGQIVEFERGDVVTDTVPQSHNPGLVRPLTENVQAVAVLLTGTARHLATRGTARPRGLHLEPRHLRAHAGDGDQQEREQSLGSHG